MASTPYQLMAPARLRAHPAGASRRQLQFDQLVPTPVAAASAQSATEKKFEVDAGILLDDQQKIEALVRGIKSKLCVKGDAIDEWRFCGDESNARLLLDSLVEELTSRLTRFNPLYAHAFRLDDVTATVMPNANKLLKELLEYLCGGPALASVREAHRYFPDDGKVILMTALVRDVMPELEDFTQTDFVFTRKVEVTAGVNPKDFIKAFTEAISGAATDLGQHGRLDISREDSVRLFLRRTCPQTYKQVAATVNVVAWTPGELPTTLMPALVMCIILGIRRKGKGKGKKGKGKQQKARVTFHPGVKQFYGNCWSCGGRHRQADCVHTQHLAAHSMRLDPEALAEGAFTDVLAARYQAAYEHSEEAFQAVCWEHGTPDICDSSESVCTYPDDGSLSFAAYLTQGDDASHAPAWAPQEWTDSEWDAWEHDSYTQEQHDEWNRLQRKASAKFQAFCCEGDDQNYDGLDFQEPLSSLSLGRVHFGSFGVGGVDRDTTPTPPADDRMDSVATPEAPLDLSAFYTAAPSITCSPCAHTLRPPGHILTQLEPVTGPEPGPFEELRRSFGTPPDLTDRERDHWDRMCSAPCFVTAGAGLYATATDPPASGHGVSAGSVVGASDEPDCPEPRDSGEDKYSDPPPPVTGPTPRRGVGRGGVPFYRHALVSTLVVLCFLGCAMADASLLVGQEDTLYGLRPLSPGGPRGGAQGTGTGILSDGGFDGGTGDGNTGYSGSCDWDWSDLEAGHGSSSGPGSDNFRSDHSQFTSSGMPPDTASQIQLFRAATTSDSEDRRRRTRHLTALALATILAIIIQCLFLFFLDFQSLSGDSALDRGFGGVSSAALHETGSVYQTTSHLAEIMVTVGGALVRMSWWLGFTWTAHGTPPPGLVFTSSSVVSAYALSRDGDGIVVDSGATGNITGTRSSGYYPSGGLSHPNSDLGWLKPP
ncbi:hypothetical protein CYMTET_25597 [Cymbomonas tetramitiformis]|uniref:Uncharacterized protein n=1 Tax=Cymbomonas tetramitiformis TaxID=36881 RepID=A0AAE0KYS7_9CHLO|nr:hypothetical protein CYMTET_25597 [Cymbomonas tetramitiformis]